MKLVISNIILYDKVHEVVGFAELKVEKGQTRVKVQHNFDSAGLIFSLSYNQQTHAFQLKSSSIASTNTFTLHQPFDLKREIFAFVTRKHSGGLTPLASGAINIQEQFTQTDANLHFDLQSPRNQSNAITANDDKVKPATQVLSQQNHQDQVTAEIPQASPHEKKLTPPQPSPKTAMVQPKDVDHDATNQKSVEVLKRAKEVDEVLRAVCSFAEEGENACKKCPYREHFFKRSMNE